MFMQFLRDCRANVAPIFAIAAIPLVVATGGAIDYSRAYDQRTVVQDALDSAALAAGKKLGIWSDTLVEAEAVNFYTGNVGHKVEQIPTITPAISGTTLTLSTTLHVKTYFLGMIGLNEFVFNLSSETTVSSTRLRVALVLDNTTSMLDDGKMTALKTATASLLTQLQGIATADGDVYVSIIPFVNDVNVGSSNYNAAWMTFDDSTCSNTSYTTQATCQSHGATWTVGNDKSWDGANGSCSISGKSPRSTCLASGTCNISGKNSQSSCTSANGCYVSGNYNSSYSSSSTCTALGSCSVSSFSTQSTCTAAGSCSLSSYTTPSTCTAAGTCSATNRTTSSSCTGNSACYSNGTYTSTYTTSSTCTGAGSCTISGKTSSSTCTGTSGCFISGVYNASDNTTTKCSNAHGTWKAGVWTADVWKAGTWTAGTWSGGGNGTWTQTGVWSAGLWTAATWTPKTHNASNWNGCVVDRGTWTAPGTTAGDDQQAYSDTYNTPFMADQTQYCPQAMLGLTYDWTALSSEVTHMAANGYTNQPIGLVWGWQSLVGGGPFGTVPAMDANHQYSQIIILMSDGLNTQDRWYKSPNTSDPDTDVDARMYNSNTGAGTCANAKAAGAIIYTVQVDTGGDPTSTLLQNCASDSNKFYKLTNASDLITTFNTIGTELSQLRIAM